MDNTQKRSETLDEFKRMNYIRLETKEIAVAEVDVFIRNHDKAIEVTTPYMYERGHRAIVNINEARTLKFIIDNFLKIHGDEK